jgi:hypothetical protein
MVTTLEPTSSGIDVDQLAVPLAVPDWPMLVDHFTDTTPTLSVADPLNAMLAAAVVTAVAPGAAIVNAGGVVSVPDPLVGTEAVCRVTVITCDT